MTMAKKYIDAEIVKAHIAPNSAIQKIIDKLPAADVREERYGAWVCEAMETDEIWTCWYECSLCGYRLDDDDYENKFKFCPICGAKMEMGESIF